MKLVADLAIVPITDIPYLEAQAVLAALRAQKNAYAPYSKYKVGAAVISLSGKIYVGVNVENHIYQVSHAEMNACAAMNTAGERRFRVVVCVANDNGIPCGACLQAMREWAGPISDLKSVTVLGVNVNTPHVVTRCTYLDALQVVDAFAPETLIEATKSA